MNLDKEVAVQDIELTRRGLLRALGGGFLVMLAVPDVLGLTSVQRGTPLPQNIGAWIHVGTDGTVTVLTGKVEVGQNARTSLTQAAAEELHMMPEKVKVIMGDTDLVPFDMGTFGSRTTPTMVPQIRKAAAATRESLLELAAKKWNVPKSSLKAENGVIRGGAHSASYSEIAKGHSIDKLIESKIALTPNSEWKTLGKSLPKVGARDIVTGKHAYTIDISLPGMLHAKVLRPPSYGAKMVSVDTSNAKAMPGVQIVQDGDFIAVVAPRVRDAEQALAALKVEWKEDPGIHFKDLFDTLRGKESLARPAIPVGSKSINSTYTAQFIAHVPLEPRAAVAEWNGSKMTVHTGTQRPFGVRSEVAKALGLEEKQVRVIVPDTGSGYGGKHSGEAAVEAARIAKAINKPVKLVWTRVEEFTFAYFRPAGVNEMVGAALPSGQLTVWSHDNFNSGNPGIESPYSISNQHAVSHESASPLRQGSYRCLGATFNNFARECHMDELAHLCGIEPLEFRLKNLPADSRLAHVLKVVADKFGWAKLKPESGKGYGIACGTDKGGFVATAVEVALNEVTKDIRVVRAVTAFDCGKILNPDHLKNQVDGAVLMGMGGALFEAIEFDKGKILNAHLSRYRVPRYSDLPNMETILVDRPSIPSAGAGEAPILAIAPAIGNAIFNANGLRLRSMPMKL